ncbi:MAG: hypothetical protein ACI936_003450, partial [Paraglaciecola sp.]
MFIKNMQSAAVLCCRWLRLHLFSLSVIAMIGLAWPQSSYAQVINCPGPPPLTTTDTDGDGYDDNIDVFPNDPIRHYDYDSDGISNFDENDDDGDGVLDVD